MVRYYRNGWPDRLAVVPFHRNNNPQQELQHSCMFLRQKVEPFCGNEHNTNKARMNRGSQNPCWIENELK